MIYSLGRPHLAVVAATLVVTGACRDAQSPKSDAQLSLLEGGTLTAAVYSTGSATDISSTGAIDPDGYTVWVDRSASQAVGTNGVATFSGVAAGDHEVALYGIAPNCNVYTVNRGSSNPRTVSVMDGGGGATDFYVGCGSWGGLFVSTTTTGVDLDGDGYTVTVDDTDTRVVPANGNVTFTELYANSHTVALSGVAGNCTVSGPNPQTVTISAGKTVPLTFSVTCSPTGSGSGTLTVTTSSTGSNLDADGYRVTVDGTISQAIAINGSTTFSVPAGANPVTLSGLASNCTVSGTNPRTVAVSAGGTSTTSFAVTCGAPQPSVSGAGQIGMGSPAPGHNVQAFDFKVGAGLTGRFTYTDYGDIHPSGQPASLITDPLTDPTTSITAYRKTSNVCSDPSQGVEFDAVGRDDQDEVLSYTVIVCDDGPEGSGRDFLSFYAPAKEYGRSGIVTSGNTVKQ